MSYSNYNNNMPHYNSMPFFCKGYPGMMSYGDADAYMMAGMPINGMPSGMSPRMPFMNEEEIPFMPDGNALALPRMPGENIYPGIPEYPLMPDFPGLPGMPQIPSMPYVPSQPRLQVPQDGMNMMPETPELTCEQLMEMMMRMNCNMDMMNEMMNNRNNMDGNMR